MSKNVIFLITFKNNLIKYLYICKVVGLFHSVTSIPRSWNNFSPLLFDPLQYNVTPSFACSGRSIPHCLYKYKILLWTALGGKGGEFFCNGWFTEVQFDKECFLCWFFLLLVGHTSRALFDTFITVDLYRCLCTKCTRRERENLLYPNLKLFWM